MFIRRRIKSTTCHPGIGQKPEFSRSWRATKLKIGIHPTFPPSKGYFIYIYIYIYIIITWCSLDEARYCKYTGRFCFCRALTDRSWSWDTHGSTCYKSRLRKKNTFMCATLGPIPLDLSLAPHLFHSTWSMKPDLINVVKEQHLVGNWNWIAIPEWPKHHHFYPPHGPTLSKP